MVDDPVKRTITPIPIGYEHGGEDAKCCLCCGGCYSGCCACKPAGDLTLSVTQWYAAYLTGGSTPYSWKKIDPPCDVEVTLKKRLYECMGSGAQEDNRRVGTVTEGGDINWSYMSAVDFYLKYGRYGQTIDGDNPGDAPGPPFGPGGPQPPMPQSGAENLAYNDYWRTSVKGYRNTACSVFPPLTLEGHENVPHKPHEGPDHDDHGDDSEIRESWNRETWGFTGKICGGCESKNYEPKTDAAGTTDGQPLEEDGSNGLPDWEFEENECGGMCISINLCCCKTDSTAGESRKCAQDSHGNYAVHPDVDDTVDSIGADGKLDGISSPYQLPWEQEMDLSTLPYPPEHYGEGYTFDEKVDEYPCKSECFKLSLNPYNCYHYSGAEGGHSGTVNGASIEGVGPFPMTMSLHSAGAWPPSSEGWPYHLEDQHEFNTPCSPCTYVRKGFLYPRTYSFPVTDGTKEWDEWNLPQPYGANHLADPDHAWEKVVFGFANDAEPLRDLGMFFSSTFGGIGDRRDEWGILYRNSDQGSSYYLPNRPTQCKCPRDEEAEEGEKGCTVDRKFMLKYALVFSSNCDCTIGIDAEAIFPEGETNAPIYTLGNPESEYEHLKPKYAIDRPWLGNENRIIIPNPAKSMHADGYLDPSLRGSRTDQAIKGIFRWDVLITESE